MNCTYCGGQRTCALFSQGGSPICTGCGNDLIGDLSAELNEVLDLLHSAERMVKDVHHNDERQYACIIAKLEERLK
jgi:hypothetical protein